MKTRRGFWCSASTLTVSAVSLGAAIITAPACSEAFSCSDRRDCEPGGGGGAAGKTNSPAFGGAPDGGIGGTPATAGIDAGGTGGTGGTGAGTPSNAGESGSGGAGGDAHGSSGHSGDANSAAGGDSNTMGGDASIIGGTNSGGTLGTGGSANGGGTLSSGGAANGGMPNLGNGGANTNPCTPPASGPAQCTAQCPCAIGAGQCTAASGCNAGLVCGANTGAKFGFSGNTCVPKHCDNDVVDADETSVDCGGECGCSAEFTRLGGAPSTASDVNGDGTVIVGGTNSKAYRWTESAGMNTIGAPNIGDSAVATGVSRNGALVTGYFLFASTQTDGAFAWMTLPVTRLSADNVAAAFGVSGNGSVIVGQIGNHNGTIWTNGSTRNFGLSVSDYGAGAQCALAADETGAVVVGYAFNSGGLQRAVVSENGAEYALNPVGGVAKSSALAVNSDGTVIVGWGESSADDSHQAYRWVRTAAGQYTAERLGDFDGGSLNSEGVDVSGDGTIVVGYGTSLSGKEPFIWNKEKGMRRLVDELISRGYEWRAATSLGTVAAISGDGSTIVGMYTNPNSQSEAWRIRLK